MRDRRVIPRSTRPTTNLSTSSASRLPDHDTSQKHIATPTAVAAEPRTEIAVLAGGCFWGVEDILRAVPGILDTEVGYTGGWVLNPTYADTHGSRSGHAE